MEIIISMNRDFYTILKTLLVGDLKNVIVSGHTMFSRNSLFSGKLFEN
jgi:hypothetical protein